MSIGTAIVLALVIILVYLGIYALVNRICESFERCALYKAYSEYQKAHINGWDSDGIQSAIGQFMSGMNGNGKGE